MFFINPFYVALQDVMGQFGMDWKLPVRSNGNKSNTDNLYDTTVVFDFQLDEGDLYDTTVVFYFHLDEGGHPIVFNIMINYVMYNCDMIACCLLLTSLTVKQ